MIRLRTIWLALLLLGMAIAAAACRGASPAAPTAQPATAATAVVTSTAAPLPDSPYPIIDDAFDFVASANLTTYRSAISFADAIDFYRLEMPFFGWTMTGSSPEPPSAIMRFERDDDTVVVGVVLDEAGEGVVVAIFPVE